MSNINTVINFIKLEPDYNKEDMVQKIMKTLNVTKSNAQVYLYNAKKKLEAGTPVKAPKAKSAKATRAEIVKKSDEEIARIKEERLAQMKSIGERKLADRAEREAKRLADLEDKQVVIDGFLDKADEYIKSLTAPTRKFIMGAE
jgi:hypothetical protein